MEENFSKERNMEWKIFSEEWKWNGRKLPVWKNRLPFHTIPCRQHKSNKIAYEVNLPAFLH